MDIQENMELEYQKKIDDIYTNRLKNIAQSATSIIIEKNNIITEKEVDIEDLNEQITYLEEKYNSTLDELSIYKKNEQSINSESNSIIQEFHNLLNDTVENKRRHREKYRQQKKDNNQYNWKQKWDEVRSKKLFLS